MNDRVPPMAESLLLLPGVVFRATQSDGGWDVVVGDGDVGYFTKRDIPDWAAVEIWLWRKIGILYGIDRATIN